MNEVTVLLLAAGDSSRLWPLSDKHLLQMLGQPLILHTYTQLIRQVFKDILVVCNSKNRSSIETILSSIKQNISLRFVEQTNSYGMAGAILTAEKLIEGKKILIINPADIYEDFLYARLQQILTRKPQGIISGTKMESYFPGGYITVKEGKVVSIKEKPNPEKKPGDTVKFVFDYVEDASHLIRAIKVVHSDADDLFEKALMHMISKNFSFTFLPYAGYWGYVKYPWNVLDVSAHFLQKIKKQVIRTKSIHASASFSGPVYIDEGVIVMENAKIIGPSYIGKGTVIGNNVLIRDSMIGNQCVVGFCSEITRSYISDRCWFHNNYIGDSVFAENISLGAHTVAANFRLDEKPVISLYKNEKIQTDKLKLGCICGSNVRIGINTSIMPGIKIGKKSYIGAGIVLNKDIPDGSYVTMKQDYKIEKNRGSISVRKHLSRTE